MTDQDWKELFERYITEVMRDEQEETEAHMFPSAIKIREMVAL